MATHFKPTRPHPLPANAVIVDQDGKPHVQMKEKRNTMYFPLSDKGTHYLKPGKKWAADVRFADGKRKRMRFSPNHDAAAIMLAKLLKKIEREKAGDIDRCAVQRKRALAADLEDWKASLKASGRDDEYIAQKREEQPGSGCVRRLRVRYDAGPLGRPI